MLGVWGGQAARVVARRWPRVRRERWFYLLISPWLDRLAALSRRPRSWVRCSLSFADWPLPQPPSFVGLDHFRTLLADPLLGRTLFNTAYYALGTVPPGIALGLGLALLLNRRRRGVTLFRTIFFLPAVVSGVATILLWGWVFNPRYGIANALLAPVGIRGPGWLQDEAWAMPALILMSLWNVGTNMIVYLAALQGVPQDLHEAAALDGAGRWARFRHVTWPLISPVTFFLLVVNLIGAFQVFTPTYILTRGGPNNAHADPAPLHLFQRLCLGPTGLRLGAGPGAVRAHPGPDASPVPPGRPLGVLRGR